MLWKCLLKIWLMVLRSRFLKVEYRSVVIVLVCIVNDMYRFRFKLFIRLISSSGVIVLVLGVIIYAALLVSSRMSSMVLVCMMMLSSVM